MLQLIASHVLHGNIGVAGWGAWATVEGHPILATGGTDTTVQLWDPVARCPLAAPLTGHTDAVGWGAWATVQGRPILATGGRDATVRLWDPVAGAPLGPPLTGHTGAVGWGVWASVARLPVLATGDHAGTVRLWDPLAGSGAELRIPLASPGAPTGRALWGAWAMAGEPILATGYFDGRARLWQPTHVPTAEADRSWADARQESHRYQSILHPTIVMWGAWASVEGCPILATGDADGTVRMWDQGGVPVGSPLHGHTQSVSWGAWASVEGRPILATGGNDGTVRMWDPIACAPLGPPLTGHTGTVWWGAWASVEGRPILATGGNDGTVRLWDPIVGAQLGPTLTGHTRAVGWGAWASVEGRPILATGGNDGAVRLWEVRDVHVEARRRPGYRSDDGAARDELERTAEAASLAELIVARSARPPLAVGVFGEWGSGKTVFLRFLEEQVQLAAGRGDDLSHDAVRQVRFNAWHYAETDLWASLVAEIFNQLATPPEHDHDVDAGTLQRQHSRLAAELVAQRKLTERLAAARDRRDDLRRARQGRRWQVLSTEQREELTAAVGAVAPDLAGEGGALYGAVSGASPWLRMQLLQWRRVWRASPSWAWVALLLTAGGAVGIGLHQWPLISSLLSGAGLLGLAAAFAAARSAIGQVRASIRRAVAAVKSVAEGQRSQVDTAVAVAEREVSELERQFQELTAAGALAALTSDRATEGGYRRNLGLMTQIREDFQQMATLLARAEHDRHARTAALADRTDVLGSGITRDEARTETVPIDAAGDTLPRIDRIVLYIDDLDRCPPARVVEVLEAVHLLLAVPLFVVVVAVDPRWLQQAVDVHYRDMLHPAPSSNNDPSTSTRTGPQVDPNDPQLSASTPAQYLEKIFQIVFTLPTVSTAGYSRMLDELTSTRVDQPATPADNTEPSSAPPQPDGDDRVDRELGSATDPEIKWDGTVELPTAPPLVRVDPYALREDERTLMRLLGPPLITTPRAVKRLTNSYGLLAAIQRQIATTPGRLNPEPDFAEGGAAQPGKPAMVLLAALIGFPGLGPALLTRLHHHAARYPCETWTEFLETLDPVCFDNGRSANPASPHLTAVQAQSWRTLLQALHDITRNAAATGVPLPEPVGEWARWVVPVGRLSFPTGRIVGSLTRRPAEQPD